MTHIKKKFDITANKLTVRIKMRLRAYLLIGLNKNQEKFKDIV